jgi:hypothetical protein
MSLATLAARYLSLINGADYVGAQAGGDAMTAFASALAAALDDIFTEEGGVCVKLINKTGVASVKGQVVQVYATTDNAYAVNAINSDMPIGIVYDAGVADGSSVRVVVAGKADILVDSAQTIARGRVVYSSGTTAGRVDSAATVPAASTHFRECGHMLETKTNTGSTLCRCVLHWN